MAGALGRVPDHGPRAARQRVTASRRAVRRTPGAEVTRDDRPAILWFRRDLRLDDLPALHACAGADAVVPLFVVDPAVLRAAGPNRRHFLAGALRALDRELGGTLVLRRGDPRRVVPARWLRLSAPRWWWLQPISVLTACAATAPWPGPECCRP